MKTISILRDRLHCSRPDVIEDFTPTKWHEERYRILECMPVYPKSINEIRDIIGRHDNCKFVIDDRWTCKRTGIKHRALMLYEHIETHDGEINVAFDSNGGLLQTIRDLDSFIVLIPLHEEKEARQSPPTKQVAVISSGNSDDYQLDLFSAWA